MKLIIIIYYVFQDSFEKIWTKIIEFLLLFGLLTNSDFMAEVYVYLALDAS